MNQTIKERGQTPALAIQNGTLFGSRDNVRLSWRTTRICVCFDAVTRWVGTVISSVLKFMTSRIAMISTFRKFIERCQSQQSPGRRILDSQRLPIRYKAGGTGCEIHRRRTGMNKLWSDVDFGESGYTNDATMEAAGYALDKWCPPFV